MMEVYPDSPMDPEEDAYPCKGCGEVLEEGKAFELAGHRWHIDCFRCNTCHTLLDSDANLLLLGDGSLICNNCTYSCSACGQKIEDLAILTGDQAYCAGCFKCRNCKKQIENLRYARTSQGMFCMECHDALMARRRKKSSKNVRKPSQNPAHLDKSLPSLPPNAVPTTTFSPDHSTPQSGTFSNSDTPTELPGSVPPSRLNSSRNDQRDLSPASSERGLHNNLTLPSTSYRHDHESDNLASFEGGLDDYIPMALDPHMAQGPSPMLEQKTRQVNGKSSSSAREHEIAGTDYFNIKEKSSRRKPLKEQKVEEPLVEHKKGDSHPTSPHIAYQERGFELSNDNYDAMRRRIPSDTAAPPARDARRDHPAQPSKTQNEQEKFRLQDAPKSRKASTRTDSKDEYMPPSLDASPLDNKAKSAPVSAHQPLTEQHVNVTSPDSTRSSQLETPTQLSPRLSQDSRFGENGPISGFDISVLPKRGDSLQKSAPVTATIPRKDVPNSRLGAVISYDNTNETSTSPLHLSSAKGADSSSANMNGGRVISRPMESPMSKSALDFVSASSERHEETAPTSGDSFVSPRAPPPRPTADLLKHKVKNASISSVRSDSVKNGDFSASPNTSRFPTSSDYMTDETSQGTGEDQEGFFNSFKRVSKSVRHARSSSDRGGRTPREQKWPRTPLNGTSGSVDKDLSSPTMSSPESRTEVMKVKQELSQVRFENKMERQKNSELRSRIAQLESEADKRTSINDVNTELREKRSTMVVLDTQKEIVINELEVITQHLQDAKHSSKPFDMPDMKDKVLRDFADALERVRDNYTPQIEDKIQKRNELNNELWYLEQQRDRALQEFAQLSNKNSQLAELNNTLITQIQDLHIKLGPSDRASNQNHGLGIYTHHTKEKSTASIDSRDVAPSITDSHLTGSTIAEHGSDVTIGNAPQVVSMAKVPAGSKQRLKFLGKGVMAKGMKAFSSNEKQHMPREGSITGLTEGMPYGNMSQSGDLPATTLPARATEADASRQGFGFFGQPKQRGGAPPVKAPPRSETPSKVPTDPSIVFGTDLEQRAVYENRRIPYVVIRCIEEVELRGMKSEGIYRKSGSKTQTDSVKDAFQAGDQSLYSDPDFDINAVASALKQYFRNLPTPLITPNIYDKLLDAMALGRDERMVAVLSAIRELPLRHKDTLECLMFHLARVVKLQDENKMSSLNCGVVFAPTIMISEDAQRDFANTKTKNDLIAFIIENCSEIFPRGKANQNGL